MGEELRKKQDEMLKQLETLTEDNRRKVTINNNDDNDNGNNNEYVGYILGRGGREVEEGAGDGEERVGEEGYGGERDTGETETGETSSGEAAREGRRAEEDEEGS